MRTNNLLVAAALFVVLVAAVLWYRAEPATTPGRGGTGPRATDGSNLTAVPAEPVAKMSPERELATPAEPEFASKDEEGNEIAGAVRDGLTVLAIHADRSPCVGTGIRVVWRKAWGVYGTDTGRTDAAGRFATTVAEFEMLERVTLQHPKYGELGNGQDMLPMASDPRTVCVVVPVMAPVQLRLLDLQGRSIAGGTIKAERKAIDSAPREYALAGEEVVATTDDQGRALLHLPVGHHEFTALASAHRALQSLAAEIPVGGRSLSLTLLRDDLRHEVAVTVVAPDLTTPVDVGGFSNFVPEQLLAQERTASDAIHRSFAASRIDPHHFTIAVDDLPWRLTAHAPGCEDAWVDVPANQTAATITLVRAPTKQMARLLCQVVVPGNEPIFPMVRVHETPDLVNGSDRPVDRFGRVVIELEAKGRVCVSARAMFKLPPTIVGPIELTPGDHEVRIELVAPKVIRGRVVDASGKAVAASVNLRRPAGPLRQLGEGVADILNGSADGDLLEVDDGVFRFLDVGPGTHELHARPKGFGWPGRVRVEPGDEKVVIRLGQGMEGMALIHGTVTEARTGKPLAEARVYCGNDEARDSGYADAQGRFALAVPPGAMTLQVWAPRFVLHGAPVTFAAGESRCDITLRLSTPLFVRVVDAGGKALAGVDVGAIDAEGQPIELVDAQGSRDGSVRTGTGGRAELRGLPDGELRLVLERGEEKKEVTVPAGTSREVPFEVRW